MELSPPVLVAIGAVFLTLIFMVIGEKKEGKSEKVYPIIMGHRPPRALHYRAPSTGGRQSRRARVTPRLDQRLDARALRHGWCGGLSPVPSCVAVASARKRLCAHWLRLDSSAWRANWRVAIWPTRAAASARPAGACAESCGKQLGSYQCPRPSVQ